MLPIDVSMCLVQGFGMRTPCARMFGANDAGIN